MLTNHILPIICHICGIQFVLLEIAKIVLCYLLRTYFFSPEEERVKTMENLHLSHLGFENTFSIARTRYFWEGMKLALEKFIARCGPCIEQSDCLQFEVELARDALITQPMKWLGADIFIFKVQMIYSLLMVVHNIVDISSLVQVPLVCR